MSASYANSRVSRYTAHPNTLHPPVPCAICLPFLARISAPPILSSSNAVIVQCFESFRVYAHISEYTRCLRPHVRAHAHIAFPPLPPLVTLGTVSLRIHCASTVAGPSLFTVYGIRHPLTTPCSLHIWQLCSIVRSSCIPHPHLTAYIIHRTHIYLSTVYVALPVIMYCVSCWWYMYILYTHSDSIDYISTLYCMALSGLLGVKPAAMAMW